MIVYWSFGDYEQIIIPNFKFLILKSKIMSKKVNVKREAYAKKQEEQGKKVVTWIFGGLIILAVIYLIWTFSMMS